MLIVAASQSSNPLTPDAGEIVVGALAFLVILWILAKAAYPNIRKTYAERTDKIEGGLKRAEEAQQEARRTLEQYRQQLAEARQEANRIREEAYQDGRRRRDEIEADARQRADDMIARTEESLDAMRQQVVLQLRAEVGRLSVDLAERIVGSELQSDERQRRLVDDFIAGLEGGAVVATGREQ